VKKVFGQSLQDQAKCKTTEDEETLLKVIDGSGTCPGTTLISGPTGSPGTRVTSGPTGSPGTRVISGPTGSPGTRVTSGPTGSPVTTLISGPTGSPGTTLISGPTGSPLGSPLISGPTGSPLGSPLISGPTGSPGTTLISGPTGSPGTTLISGPTGSPGTTLISGPTVNLVDKSFYNVATTYLFTRGSTYIKFSSGSFENGSYTITGPNSITMDFDSWTVTDTTITNSSFIRYGIVTKKMTIDDVIGKAIRNDSTGQIVQFDLIQTITFFENFVIWPNIFLSYNPFAQKFYDPRTQTNWSWYDITFKGTVQGISLVGRIYYSSFDKIYIKFNTSSVNVYNESKQFVTTFPVTIIESDITWNAKSYVYLSSMDEIIYKSDTSKYFIRVSVDL
jgi:hypothetical protein